MLVKDVNVQAISSKILYQEGNPLHLLWIRSYSQCSSYFNYWYSFLYFLDWCWILWIFKLLITSFDLKFLCILGRRVLLVLLLGWSRVGNLGTGCLPARFWVADCMHDRATSLIIGFHLLKLIYAEVESASETCQMSIRRRFVKMVMRFRHSDVNFEITYDDHPKT